MSAHELLARLRALRLHNAKLVNDPAVDAATAREATDVFLMVGQVAKAVRANLAFPHEVTQSDIEQPDGTVEHLVMCECGWTDLVDGEWTGTYAGLAEATAAHLDAPYLPGMTRSTLADVDDYWTGELAAAATFSEESPLGRLMS